MAEVYPSDADLNALSGTQDAEQEILAPTANTDPWKTEFYKLYYRLLAVARRAGDLRVYKDAALTYGVRAGKYFDGDTLVSYAGSTGNALTNNATNYIYLLAAGTLTINTTGFPVPSVTPHIRLAVITTSAGTYAPESGHLVDWRGTSFLQTPAGAPGLMGYAPDAVVIVRRGATDAASGTNLKAAYTAAKSLTPGGSALAADNRAILIVPPGKYDFGSTAWDVDTDFVDPVGKGICRVSLKDAITWVGAPYASAVSAVTPANAEFHNPATVLICDTDTEVVNVTCRDVHMSGFHIVHETSDKIGLKIDNANACDRGRFTDLGFTVPGSSFAITDGVNTEIAGYFENCHTPGPHLLGNVGTLSCTAKHCTGSTESFDVASGGTLSGHFEDCVALACGFGSFVNPNVTGTFIRCVCEAGFNTGVPGAAFTGTCIDCCVSQGWEKDVQGKLVRCYATNALAHQSTGAELVECEFGPGAVMGGGDGAYDENTVLRRCKITSTASIEKFQGKMIDCEVEVTSGDGIILAQNKVGGSDRTAHGLSDTTTIVFLDVDYTAEFPVGSFVYHPTQTTFHRVTSVAMANGGDADGNDDTVVVCSPAVGGADDWDGEACRAYYAPVIIGCTIISGDEAIDTDAAPTPAIIDGCRADQDWDDTDVVNMIASPNNAFDEEHLASTYLEF